MWQKRSSEQGGWRRRQPQGASQDALQRSAARMRRSIASARALTARKRPQAGLTRPFFPISLARVKPFSAACSALFHQSIVRESRERDEPCGQELSAAAWLQQTEGCGSAGEVAITLLDCREATAARPALHAGAAERHFHLSSQQPCHGPSAVSASLLQPNQPASSPQAAPPQLPADRPAASASLRPPCSARRA